MKFEIDILRPNHERGGNDPNDWTTVPRIFHGLPEVYDALAVLLDRANAVPRYASGGFE